ncbi:MAG: type II secretion system protein GspN [Desulfosalsimonas sp.]|uniref:type II secretion system protein GspN n=1 Tax=Desulfosalsimonas sp. TaxID=3073848 RepID=UPI003970D73D
MTKKSKKRLAWICYISMLAAVFLYLLFPANAVKKYLEHQVRKASDKAVSLEITAVKPGFPPCLVINEATLVYRQMDALETGRTILSPAYRKLPGIFDTLDFEISLGDGRALGWVAMEDARGTDNSFHIRFENADLESIVLIRNMSGHTVSGSLDGTIEFDGSFPGQSGSGTIELAARQCTVALQEAVFGIKQLTFESIEADLEIEDQQVNIRQLRLDGSQVSAEGTGRILIRRPFENSRIQISARLRPHPALARAMEGLLPERSTSGGDISLRIAGSLKQPSWQIR